MLREQRFLDRNRRVFENPPIGHCRFLCSNRGRGDNGAAAGCGAERSRERCGLPFSCPLLTTSAGKSRQRGATSGARRRADFIDRIAYSGIARHSPAKTG